MTARKRLLIFPLLFILLVALKLHGFSLSYWHNLIDGSKPTECLFGSRPQNIRADDFSLEIPTMLAQTVHVPSFPVVNHNIYFDTNMMAPIRAPVKSLVTVFQPSLWGFFVGSDVGVSWLWWCLVFGTFIPAFLFFLEITNRDRFLSVCGSLLIGFSPFFQLWSFHKAEVFAGALLSLVFFLYFLRASTTKMKLVWAIALGWSLGEFAFGHIYPPYQITMAYLCLLVSVPLALNLEIKKSTNLFLFLSLAVLSVGVYSFVSNAGDSLRILAETEYPGKRFSTGGGFPFWEFFSNTFMSRHWMQDYGLLANICESAFGFLFFPGLAICTAQSTFRNKKADFIQWALVAFGSALLLYSVIGIPEWLARITLFSKVPSNRVGMALVLLDITLLLRLLAKPAKYGKLPAVVLFLVLIGSGLSFKTQFPELPYFVLIVAPTVFSFLFYFMFEIPNGKRWLKLLIFGSFLYTMSFNPIVRGGSEYLYGNPLSQKILELQRSEPSARWAAFGLGNAGDLLKLLGMPTIGGYQGVPNFEVWKSFDPEGKYKSYYNIAGFVYFQPTKSKSVQFEGGNQVLVVSVQPEDLASGLNIRYFLAPKIDKNFLDGFRSLKSVYEYGNFVIYEKERSGGS